MKPRPFVGRARELSDLEGGLRDAVAGRGSLFMIGGESGIGKTRLAEEISARATSSGATAVWGACWERGGAPSYWPWIQVIRGLSERAELREVMEVLGPKGPLVAQIAPELSEAVPDLGEAPPLDSEQARFSLFDAVTSFIRVMSSAAPTVVVLDDMHAADQASLLLLEFAARSVHDQPTQIVVTYRDTEARRREDAGGLFAGLERAGNRVRLSGLKRAELADLVAGEAGADSPGLVAQLHTVTEGNPFFVDEVIRLLWDEGLLDIGSDTASLPFRLPDGVRETINRRLEPLSEEAVEVLSFAALIGRDFGVDLLCEASGRPHQEVVASLDGAVEAGILRQVPGAFGRYTFGHRLLRETLYEGIDVTERGELHRRTGEALERRWKDRSPQPLHALAHHFLEAGASGEPGTAERAVDYAERAAYDSMEKLAYEQAADLFRDALAAAELTDPDEARRCRLQIARGGAELLAGHTTQAKTTLREAAETARRIGHAELLAEAALTFASRGLATGVVDEELSGLLAEALDQLPPDSGALRARVSARLAASLYWSASSEQRERLVSDAIETARALDDPATLAWVLIDAHLATWDPDSIERSVPWADEVVALSESLGDVELALHVYFWRISLMLERADPVAMHHDMASYARAAGSLHQPRSQAIVVLHRALRALIEGRLEDCERLIGEGATVAPELAEDPIVTLIVGSLSFTLRMAQGRLGEIEAPVRDFADSYPTMPGWRAALTRVYLDTGRDDDLRHEFERLAHDDFAILPRDNIWLVSIVVLAECCAHLRDADRAAVLSRMLEPLSGRIANGPVSYFGPVDRYLALLAGAQGEYEEAWRYLRQARETARTLRASGTLAQLTLDEATIRQSRGEEGDLEKSEGLLAEARRLAQELKMDGVVAKIRALSQSEDSIAAAAAGIPGLGRSLRDHAAPDGTVTIMFSDVESSTELNERLGDRAWLDLLRTHNALLREHVAAQGGFEVKSWGDGFMFAFPSASRGLASAVAVQRAFEAHNAAEPSSRLMLRIGLHTGEALRDDQDFFGRAVNLAARIASHARGGEILVSSVLRDLVQGSGFAFAPAGEETLKGIAEPQRLFAVDWSESGEGAG